MRHTRRPTNPRLSGLEVQLARASRFMETVDPVAAARATELVDDLLQPLLPQMRVEAGLPARPPPLAYLRARFGTATFADTPVPSHNVFTFWNRPVGTAPPLVQACTAQMRRVYPGVQVLDGAAARALVEIPDRIATVLEADRPAHFSDYVRTRVLAEHGGIWLDATLWVGRPLDNLLENCLRTGTVFPRWMRKTIGNWFIASQPGAPLLTMQRLALEAWWDERDDLPDYFLYHRIFEVLLRRVPELRGWWDATPLVSAAEAHLLQLTMMEPFDATDFARLTTDSPIQKLSYKYDTVPEGSTVSHLISARNVRP